VSRTRLKRRPLCAFVWAEGNLPSTPGHQTRSPPLRHHRQPTGCLPQASPTRVAAIYVTSDLFEIFTYFCIIGFEDGIGCEKCFRNDYDFLPDIYFHLLQLNQQSLHPNLLTSNCQEVNSWVSSYVADRSLQVRLTLEKFVLRNALVIRALKAEYLISIMVQDFICIVGR